MPNNAPMTAALRRASLKQRFLATTILFMIVAAGISGYALRVNRQQTASLDWAGRVFAANESLHSASDAVTSARRGARTFLLYGDASGLTQYQSSIKDFETDFATARAILANDDPAVVSALDNLHLAVLNWSAGDADKGILLRQSWTGPESALQSAAIVFAQDPTAKALFETVTTQLNAALSDVRAALEKRVVNIQDQNQNLTWIVVGALFFMLASSAAIAVFLYRGIARPLAQLSDAALGIADGDLTRRTRIERGDEIGRAANAFDEMARRLQQLVARLENTQAELSDREARLTTILANVGDAILILSPDGSIVEANAAAEAMFDKPGIAIKGMPASRFIRRQDDMNVGGVFKELESGPTKRDIVAFRASGERFPAESTASRARINGVWHAVLCLRDMSERVGVEEALRRGYAAAERSRLLTRSVIDAANDVMLFVSLERRVVLVNRRHADLFGLADDDVLDRPIDQLGPIYQRILGDAEPFLDAIRAPFQAGETSRSVVFTQQWPAQRELNLIVLQVRGKDGSMMGTLCVIRDVSAEREADRLKSDFVSLVSHELRTPLTSIKGYVDLLLEGEVGPLSSDQSSFLEIVASSATRLVSLTNDLLDVSRIEAGKLDLHPAPMEIAPQVRSVAATLQPQIDAKRQRLSVELAGDLPLLMADQNRFIQVLTNLVSNANKYTGDGGRIAIRVAQIGDKVRFDVADTGAGLTAEEQSRLFTRFYRARNRATQQAGGTGLGLAISKSLVEAQGGTIGVISAPGEGSTFSFTLPVFQSDAAGRAGTGILAPVGTGSLPRGGTGKLVPGTGRLASGDEPVAGSILIVEDDADIASLLQRYLQRAGYRTKIATDGASALAFAAAEDPSLITLDVALPDMDGFTVLEQLRANEATCAIPVLFISILPSPEQTQSLGAIDYLPKPVDERLLIDRIRLILSDSANSLILVADDDEATRGLLRERLTRAGYRVIEASDGWEAIAIATSQPLSMALIDVRMPELSGIETLERLRALPETARLPVVMMTASPGLQDAQVLAIEGLGSTLLRGKNLSAQELADLISGQILPFEDSLTAAGSRVEKTT
jgi:PAS domain S-box-containing protein